jgi:hypothetical protein
MFLDKPEDIALFNRLMDSNPTLEPYFAELALWCYLHDKDKYLALVEESKNETDRLCLVDLAKQDTHHRLHLKDISDALEN